MLAPVRQVKIRAESDRDRIIRERPERLPFLRSILDCICATEELVTRALVLEKSNVEQDRAAYLMVAAQVKAHIAGIKASLDAVESDSPLPAGITLPLTDVLPDDVREQIEALWATRLVADSEDRQLLAVTELRLRLIHAGRILSERLTADHETTERAQMRTLQSLAEKYLPAAA